jgi:hypothetical protein
MLTLFVSFLKQFFNAEREENERLLFMTHFVLLLKRILREWSRRECQACMQHFEKTHNHYFRQKVIVYSSEYKAHVWQSSYKTSFKIWIQEPLLQILQKNLL